MSRSLTLFLILILTPMCFAQQTASLSPKQEAIKHKAEHLAPDARISLVPFHGEEAFGKFVSSDQQGLTFYEIDRKMEVTLNYADIRKIKDGYGGYNFVQRRHTDRTTGLVVTLIIVGGLAAVIFAAAATK